jgi:hypothetical protein
MTRRHGKQVTSTDNARHASSVTCRTEASEGKPVACHSPRGLAVFELAGMMAIFDFQ